MRAGNVAWKVALAGSLLGAGLFGLLLSHAAPVSTPVASVEPEPEPQAQPAHAKVLPWIHLERRTAYIPPQCYAQTRGADGKVRNPCFACHVQGRAPNLIDDANLQITASLPAPARENPWTNLFVDRRAELSRMSDEDILAYVRESNFRAPDGTLLLGGASAADEELAYLEVHFQFDAEGFDVAPDGRSSGFRSYGFRPLPGMFVPANGSMGDALIRLPDVFRQDQAGHYDREVYTLNLAVVEALIKHESVPIRTVDEARYGVDLDRNGKIGSAREVRFAWAPREGQTMSYVGRAREALARGVVALSPGLFPEGTEFLHSVRYLDVQDGRVTMAARFKELRYARKESFLPYEELERLAAAEAREEALNPDTTRDLIGSEEHGLRNGLGWRYQGFIEDAQGKLRPQSYEELAFCVGCHSGLGVTSDGIFSFARKLDDAAHAYGWFHPSQPGRPAAPVADARRADGQGEYALYLRSALGGDDYGANDELRARFFAPDGSARADAFAALEHDVSSLLLPSPERALALDGAYRAIVREQSYTRGRDATLAPVAGAQRSLAADAPTSISEAVAPAWKSPHNAPRRRGG
jgi:hypothetical protein